MPNEGLEPKVSAGSVSWVLMPCRVVANKPSKQVSVLATVPHLVHLAVVVVQVEVEEASFAAVAS